MCIGKAVDVEMLPRQSPVTLTELHLLSPPDPPFCCLRVISQPDIFYLLERYFSSYPM